MGHPSEPLTQTATQGGSPYPVRHLPSSYDRGVQIAAARLRVICDRRLGNETPDWIKQLAAEKYAHEEP